jgi:hypothetical protein
MLLAITVDLRPSALLKQIPLLVDMADLQYLHQEETVSKVVGATEVMDLEQAVRAVLRGQQIPGQELVVAQVDTSRHKSTLLLAPTPTA